MKRQTTQHTARLQEKHCCYFHYTFLKCPSTTFHISQSVLTEPSSGQPRLLCLPWNVKGLCINKQIFFKMKPDEDLKVQPEYRRPQLFKIARDAAFQKFLQLVLAF